MSERTCSVPTCTKPHEALGLCTSHRRRLRTKGDVLAHIPLRTYRPGAQCVVEGCDRPLEAKSLCNGHYQRKLKGVSDLSTPVQQRDPGRTCEVASCGKPADARGLCSGHYSRLKTKGDVLADTPFRVEMFSPGGECLRTGCPTPSHTAGLCRLHLGQRNRLERPEIYVEKDVRRRARLAGATIETFDRREIFERDGWMCKLCGQPINRTLRGPDPASVSLDHVLPLSLGGEHSRTNCQTAHLGCNKRKGARVDGDFVWRASA